MSSNPTQPRFGDQGEGVSFPPEDDAEGHRYTASADGDQPEGIYVRSAEGDGGSEGFRVLADSDDDTEGHRASAAAEGGPSSGPDGYRLVMADGGEDDTEGHRVAFADGEGGPDSGPEGHKLVPLDGGEDDTEGHIRVNSADGEQDGGPDGVLAR